MSKEFFSSRVKNLHPYTPGEQCHDRPYIKLNANENPYPPSPKILDALATIMQNRKQLALYPDNESSALREAVATMLNSTGGSLCCKKAIDNITPDMVFCSNGSDEVLSFVFCAFFDSSTPLICPTHSYSFYPVFCDFYGIKPLCVPLNTDWTLDTNAIVEAAKKYNAPVIIANPNAPTALALTLEEVRDLLLKLPADKVCVIDEAYMDFGDESALPLLKDFDNLVIVRTFSKSMSLAGMRVGYAVASPLLIQSIFTVKNSFNHFPLDIITQKIAQVACTDIDYYEKNALSIKKERDSFIDFLKQQGYYTTLSKTNFVFTKHECKHGKDIYLSLKQQGILVRRFDTQGIQEYLRITIGTKDEMSTLRSALLL